MDSPVGAFMIHPVIQHFPSQRLLQNKKKKAGSALDKSGYLFQSLDACLTNFLITNTEFCQLNRRFLCAVVSSDLLILFSSFCTWEPLIVWC